MKKLIVVILTLIFTISLSSCYQDFEKDSLENYIINITEQGSGYSNFEIDHPDYFLPSNSFLVDYDYIESFYIWREDDPIRGMFTAKVRPEISLLCLKYEKNVYLTAKHYMLQEIEPYNNKIYEYNNYKFYENSNFIELTEVRQFPKYFTMACYNDETCTLMFLGLNAATIYGTPCIEEQYLNDIDNNWISFIDTYYGEYYDFSK